MPDTVARAYLGNEVFSHAQIASTLNPALQQLIIFPTEKCNFRCTYCYEDFAIGKMKEPVLQGIERFLARRVPELTELATDWFGGEPLVARDVVLRLSSYASRLCKEQGVALRGGMTTNAYLLNFALFEELLSYDQRFFQVTLDGWERGHDVLRKLASGRGTFERIWDNLLATRASGQDFHIQIRIHVRRDNRESLETLLDRIAESFGNDPRYTLDFEHLRNLGGAGGKTVDRPMSLAELREVETALRERYDRAVAAAADPAAAVPRIAPPSRPPSLVGEFKGDAAPGAAPYICYAAKPNSLLIRADGRIGKCTVALNDDRNTIGRINPDGSVTIDNALLQPWVRGLATLDENALGCPLGGMMSMAGGGS